jgi:pyochelin biosynthetic protein PchC
VTAATPDRTWWRCPCPRDGGTRLLCMPHAGGSASAFNGWSRRLPADVELSGLQYPGHGDRITEPLPADLRELAVDAALAALALADRPVALYGHSMGALVAFHIAGALTRLGRPPVRLTVSGMPGPALVRPGAVHAAGDDAVLGELRRLGGVPEEVFAEPDLRRTVLRVTRADYALVETYRARPDEVLDVPITVHRGLDDPEVDADEAAAWAITTRSGTVHRTFRGDHFHPFADPDPVLADLTTGDAP